MVTSTILVLSLVATSFAALVWAVTCTHVLVRRRHGSRHTTCQETSEIDLVVSWVDGEDSVRADIRRQYWRVAYPESAISDIPIKRLSRRGRPELRFLLRSARRYAPWVRRVFVVCSGGQDPAGVIDPCDRERITVIDDSEILLPTSLPTFNSHAIEANLDRIPELTEKFLYACDDMWFCAPMVPEDFFDEGAAITYVDGKILAPFGEFTDEQAHRAAWTRNQQLLGQRVPRPDHQITALTRSSFQRARSRFADEFERTSHSRFRCAKDIHPIGLSQFIETKPENLRPRRSINFGITESVLRNRLLMNWHWLVNPRATLLCFNDNLQSTENEDAINEWYSTVMEKIAGAEGET